MYSKLLSILHNQDHALSKTRAGVGPVSLNMKVRRDSIKAINKTNEFISDRLMKAHCYVPSKETLDKHAVRADKFRRFASVRRENG